MKEFREVDICSSLHSFDFTFNISEYIRDVLVNKHSLVVTIILADKEEEENSCNNMAKMSALLKPAAFNVKTDGDPEQLLQQFVEYVEIFEMFLNATEVDGKDGRVDGEYPAISSLSSEDDNENSDDEEEEEQSEDIQSEEEDDISSLSSEDDNKNSDDEEEEENYEDIQSEEEDGRVDGESLAIS